MIRRAWLPVLAACALALAAGCADETTGPTGTSDVSGDSEPADPDMQDPTCDDPAWTAGACVAGTTQTTPAVGADHVPWPDPLTYAQDPPSSGSHRPQWGRWGEYEYLPPQRWLHNLEHGGVALLYHPCVGSDVVDALRAFAQARPDDDGGAFRWVLTPYPGLSSAVAVVAWEELYQAECVDVDEIGAFVDANYRTAPEDIGVDGPYDLLWLGR